MEIVTKGKHFVILFSRVVIFSSPVLIRRDLYSFVKITVLFNLFVFHCVFLLIMKNLDKVTIFIDLLT